MSTAAAAAVKNPTMYGIIAPRKMTLNFEHSVSRTAPVYNLDTDIKTIIFQSNAWRAPDKLKYIGNPELNITSDNSINELYVNPCPHCGYGNVLMFIFEMTDGHFLYMTPWEGCLTYSDDSINAVNTNGAIVGVSFDDIHDYAMTQKDRDIYATIATLCHPLDHSE